MLPLKKIATSSVGRKLLMSLSGLALVGFVITHLLGNLPLYWNGANAFNQYSDNLASLGKLLIVAEMGLIAMTLIHIVTAITLKSKNAAARGSAYVMSRTKGGPSKAGLASKNMIITGLVLLGFLIWHILQFKFGPGVLEGYVTTVNDKPMRDLHRLVYETFKDPIFVALYSGVMLFLGLHLSHGIWSAFQSASLSNKNISATIYKGAFALSVLLSAGFFFIPIAIYFDLYKVFTS